MTVKRRVVVTGATRGLGRALVTELIRAGHTVLGCGRSQADCDALNRAHGPANVFTRVDVSDRAAVEDWASVVLGIIGAPDLIINNAGLMNEPAPLWLVPAAEFDKVIDVNIKGTVNVLRAFLPAMVEHKAGVVVNFSSGWGRSTSPDVAPYCASKYAVEGLTLALAQELPNGMAAIPLNPGVINTDMLRLAWKDEAAGFPDPETWAKTAAPFILSLGPRQNGHSLAVREYGGI
jgi:NAD(P)-dependent dehydrogenase (short-subunit alcohol dehydrogenase family)